MTILLDTSVLIDALNQRGGRREFLLKLVEQGHDLASCAVTVAEIYAGMRPAEARKTSAWLASLIYYETTQSAAKRAGDLKASWAKKGRTLALPDALIAAVAIEHGLSLATENVKDFPMHELHLLPLPRPH